MAADPEIVALLTDPVIQQVRAVQVDPIKPKLQLPGTKYLTLDCDVLLSTSAFKFNLRRYTTGVLRMLLEPRGRAAHVDPTKTQVETAWN